MQNEYIHLINTGGRHDIIPLCHYVRLVMWKGDIWTKGGETIEEDF